jgi:hypothetical protein
MYWGVSKTQHTTAQNQPRVPNPFSFFCFNHHFLPPSQAFKTTGIDKKLIPKDIF